MSAHIAAWGRLVADPVPRTGKSGKPWATARLAVTLPVPYGADDGADAPTLWLAVTVFGERLTDTLARHRKGECVSVAGTLEMRPYTARDGSQRDGWTVIADSVIGPRSPRPKGGGKPRADGNAGNAGRADPARQGPPDPEPPPFDDELPY